MQLSLSQAARETGKAKSTISRAIKSGKLSAEKNKNGAFSIESSELFRAFPGTPKRNSCVKNVTVAQPSNSPQETLKIAIELAKLEAEKAAWLEHKQFLERELEDWKEQAQKQTLLLEQHIRKKKKTSNKNYWGFFR